MARRGHHTLDEIKSMVLAAAEDLVVEGGLPLLTARRIATKIGYTVGSIYMVFGSMSDLIMHLKARVLDDISQEIEQIQAANTKQCLEELAEVYIRYARQNFNRWSMVFEHRLPEDLEIPDWYQKNLDNLYSKFEDEFAKLEPELSPEQLKRTALAFLAGLYGICVFTLITPLGGRSDKDIKETAALLIAKFTHGRRVNSIGIKPPKKNNNKEAKGQLLTAYSA
jgi:AcrR family transcriptional regulator